MNSINSIESELIFSKEGILVRFKRKSMVATSVAEFVDIPQVSEVWDEVMKPYEAFSRKPMELIVTSIEPKIENGILKEIKLKLVDIKETTSIMDESFSTVVDVKTDENVKIVKSIRRITRDAIKKVPPDGTRVRFDRNGITYETKTDIRSGEEDTLNTLVSDLFRTTDGKKASLNVWRDISARFFDGRMWHNLNELRA